MTVLRWSIIVHLMILLPSFIMYSQNLEELELKEGSKIWLEGKTNISEYYCTIDSSRLRAKGSFYHETGHKDSLVIEPDHLSFTLYVSSIHCGNKVMNRDVRKALNYPEDRKIVYTYKGLDASPEIKNIYTWNKHVIQGILEIKNTRNRVVFNVRAKHLEDHRFHVKGKHNIDMLQYDVDPPSRLNGLIQARKKLTVHFDVIIGSKN